MAVPTDLEPVRTHSSEADAAATPPGQHSAPARRHALVWSVLAGYVAFTAVAAFTADSSTSNGRLLWAAVPIPMSAWFGLSSSLMARRCTGARRKFWAVLAIGIGVMVAAQVWRAATLVVFPTDLVEAVYGGLSTVGILTFLSALVLRLRMRAPSTWGVQYLDAAAVGVVVWTVAMLPVAGGISGAPIDVYLIAVQPLLLMTLANGSGGALFTQVPWSQKRTEVLLAIALAVGFVEATVEVYAIVLHADRYSPLALITLSAAFGIAAIATYFEDPAARPAIISLEDYDSVAWPYMLLGVLPVLAMWMVLSEKRAEELVASLGLLAGFVVVVLRQLQILGTQRTMIEDEARMTDEMRQDTDVSLALLRASADLSRAPDRTAAELSVVGALKAVTRAPHVFVLGAKGRVTSESDIDAVVDMTTLLRLAEQRPWVRGEPSRPFRYNISAVEGVASPVRSAEGRLRAVVCAGGSGWRMAANEADLLAGLARQLEIALDRLVLMDSLAVVERRYREVIDLLPVGIVEVRGDGTVVRANIAFAAICGLQSSEIVGCVVGELFQSVELDPPGLLDIARLSDEVRCRATVIVRSGEVRSLAIRAWRLQARDGRVEAVGVVRDVTTLGRLRRRMQAAAEVIESDVLAAAARSMLLVDAARVRVHELEFTTATEPLWKASRAGAVAVLDEAIGSVGDLAARLGARRGGEP